MMHGFFGHCLPGSLEEKRGVLADTPAGPARQLEKLWFAHCMGKMERKFYR